MRGVERRCRSIRVARADLCCVLVRWIVKGRILITPVPQPENSYLERERMVVAWFAQKNRLFGKKASPLDVSYVAIL